MTDTRERGKVDFQDVAKLATQPQPSAQSAEEKSENSGIIHLSALAAAETSSADKPEVPKKPDAPPPASTPVARPASSDPRSQPRAESASLTAHEGSRLRETRWSAWIALGAGMVLGGLVAGMLFEARASSSASRTSGTGSTLQQSALSPSLPTMVTKGAPTAGHGSTMEEHPIDPSVLPPPSPATTQARASVASAAPRVPGGTASPSLASRATTAASAPIATSGETEPPAVVRRPSTDDSLEALIKRSVGGTDHDSARGAQPSGAGTAETAAGGLPAKPAMGAVQGALGTVMPAARYCLGPDDPVSRATITFKSDGSVQNIAVSGDAAGQPAEACIRSRLMGARVPPFASPTFTWTVTVRPAN